MIFLAGITAHPGGAAQWVVFDNIGQAITPLIACGVCLHVARRYDGRIRRTWQLIGLGSLSWGAGQIMWTIYQVGLHETPAVPSICDLGFLMSPICIVLGILGFVETPAGFKSWLRAVLEGALIASGLLVSVWTVLIGPDIAITRAPLLQQLVSLAYPAFDAVAMSAMLFVLTRSRIYHARDLIWLGSAICMLAVADSYFWYLTTFKNSGAVNPTDAGWFIGFLLIAGAASHFHREIGESELTEPSSHQEVEADEGNSRQMIRRHWLIGAVPELVAFFGLVVASGQRLATSSGTFDRPGTWIIVGIALLALTHGVAVVAENHALTENLEERVLARTLALLGREHYFEALFERSSDTVLVVSQDLIITSFSHGVRHGYGWRKSELVGHHLSEFDGRFDPLIGLLNHGVNVPGRVEELAWDFTDESGRVRHAESTIANLVDDSHVDGYVINTRDVTSQRQLELELRRQAFEDQLTGLTNRALFNDRAEHALSSVARTTSPRRRPPRRP